LPWQKSKEWNRRPEPDRIGDFRKPAVNKAKRLKADIRPKVRFMNSIMPNQKILDSKTLFEAVQQANETYQGLWNQWELAKAENMSFKRRNLELIEEIKRLQKENRKLQVKLAELKGEENGHFKTKSAPWDAALEPRLTSGPGDCLPLSGGSNRGDTGGKRPDQPAP